MPSFTQQIPNLHENGPCVEVYISMGSAAQLALHRQGGTQKPPVKAWAMIDTGATGSVIRQGIAAQLGLMPVGKKNISTPTSSNTPCHEYLVQFVFPNHVVYETTAIEAPLVGQHIQCLVGRDVLASGVLVYVGYTNTFTLSF